MMIAVDIDSILTAEPANTAELLKQLLHGRNKVYLLATALADEPTLAARQVQLKELGFKKGLHYSEIISMPGFNYQQILYGVATFCRDKQIDVIFTTDEASIGYINQLSARTTCFSLVRSTAEVNEAMMNFVTD